MSRAAIDAFASLVELPHRMAALEARLAKLEQARVLAVADEDRIGSAEVAKMLGITRRALQERFRRARLAGERHPLDNAHEVDGVRAWKRGEVLRFLGQQGRAR